MEKQVTHNLSIHFFECMCVCARVQWPRSELGIPQSVGMATLRSAQHWRETRRDEILHVTEEVTYYRVYAPSSLCRIRLKSLFTVNAPCALRLHFLSACHGLIG